MYSGELSTQNSDGRLKDEVNVVCLADVVPQEVDWLWKGFVALGKVTLVAGDPGVGKSFLTLDMAARVSAGSPWPNEPGVAREPASVLLLSSEDALDDTIRPRLDRMGAECSQVYAIESITVTRPGKTAFERGVNLTRDIAALEAEINRRKSCKLVVIDPISAYLGDANANDNTEVRQILTELGKLAERCHVALVVVSHLRKGEGSPMNRVIGSVAWLAAVRGAWLVARDPDDPERRLLLPLKNNIATDVGGLAYQIPKEGADQGTVCWEEDPVSMTAEEVFAEPVKRRGPAPVAKERAKEWLEKQLKCGPRASADITEAARAVGISDVTLRRAREELGVVTKKVKNYTEWTLPEFVQDAADLKPEQLEQVDWPYQDGLEDVQDDGDSENYSADCDDSW